MESNAALAETSRWRAKSVRNFSSFFSLERFFGHFQQGRHVAAEPESVTIFGGKSFVLSPHYFAHRQIACEGVHRFDQRSKRGGTKTVQGLKKNQRVCPCNKRTGGRIY